MVHVTIMIMKMITLNDYGLSAAQLKAVSIHDIRLGYVAFPLFNIKVDVS